MAKLSKDYAQYGEAKSGGKTRLVRKQDADRDYVRRMRSG